MKLKILFLGFRHRHIYSLYQRVASSDAAEIAACIETDGDARKAAEAALGAVFSEKSYEEWLNTDIDAVAIGGAYGDRGEAIIKVLKAGKHVIADKPICTEIGQLSAIRALSREKGVAVACMLDLRYIPQALKAKEVLDSGRLGEVCNVTFGGQHYLDYDNRPRWYFEKGMHGGTINDLAIHGIDLVRFLTGLAFGKIDAARTWNAYAVCHKDFKDSAMFMARLENGAGVLADVSYSAPSQVFSMPTYWEFRFWCRKGLLTFNYADRCVTLYEAGKTFPTVIETKDAEGDWFDDFVGQIRTGDLSMNESLFESTETALAIQAQADREGDE